MKNNNYYKISINQNQMLNYINQNTIVKYKIVNLYNNKQIIINNNQYHKHKVKNINKKIKLKDQKEIYNYKKNNNKMILKINKNNPISDYLIWNYN